MIDSLKSTITTAAIVFAGMVMNEKARAQELVDNFAGNLADDPMEWVHRTPESQKQYERFFYKDTLDIPDNMSYAEYVDWFKENKQEVNKFINYADSVLTTLPYHLKQKSDIVESIHNNYAFKTPNDVSFQKLNTTINLIDALYFDGGNENKVSEYLGEAYLKNREKVSGLASQMSKSLDKHNNIHVIGTGDKAFFVQNVGMPVLSKDKEFELGLSKHEGWKLIGFGGLVPAYSNSASLNKSLFNQSVISACQKRLEMIYDEKISIDGFWLGVGGQELAHVYFREKNELKELGSDFVTCAIDKESSKVLCMMRLTDFYGTIKRYLSVREGMGSEQYKDIYDYFYSKFSTDELAKIYASDDLDDWLSKNKSKAQSLVDGYYKDALKFIEESRK